MVVLPGTLLYTVVLQLLIATSTVPGELKGLYYVHEKYGLLPWSTLFQPAVKLARDGFPVSDDFATAMRLASEYSDFLSEDPAWAKDFAPNGTRLGPGDIMTRKRYSRTLDAVAKGGPDGFYRGPVAGATVRALRKTNGTMTLEDLERYQAVSRAPVEIPYKDFRLYGCGCPASGAVALSVLKVLEGYDDYWDDQHLRVHRLDEAIRFGYAKVGLSSEIPDSCSANAYREQA